MAWASVVLVVWVLGGTSETECIECRTLFFFEHGGTKTVKVPNGRFQQHFTNSLQKAAHQ